MSSPPPPPPAAPVDDPSLQHPPAPLRLPPGIPIDPDLLQPYLGSLIHLSDSMTGVELGNINSPTTGEAQTEHQEDVTPAPYQNVELIPTDMVQPLTPSNHSTRDTPRIRPLPLPPSPIRHLLIRRKPLPPTTILPTHAAPTPRPTPTSHLYKDYLHKLPHTHFTEHAAPGTCLACDVTTAVTHYTCDSCGLALCSVCHYLITEDAIRGSLRLLIQHAARWKFGYSAGFLERERAEKEAEWERERVEAEREKERVKEREKERLARVVEEEDEEGGGVLVDMGEGVAEMVQRMERGRGEFPGGLVQVGMGGEGGEGEEGEEGEVEDIVL